MKPPVMSPPARAHGRISLRRHLLVAALAVVALVGGIGGWAVTAEIAGAVVASGVVVVDTNVKKVQHPSGGVVGEIHVRDGARVRQGEVVVRLDATVARANLAMVAKSLDELAARQARLEAERDGAREVTFPDEFTARTRQPDVQRLRDAEIRVFELRRAAREGQRDQLKQRILQLREQIEGLELQTKAKAKEITFIKQELEGVQDLWRKNLIPISRLTSLSREETRLDGERGSMIATNAQTKGKITETELQILQIEQDLRSEVAKELREIQAKVGELVERRIAAEDQLARIDIRAPQDGVVHQLAVHTVGGVVPPGEPLMLVVPDADDLSIEVKVETQDIDQLRLGQKTVLRLSAFNQRTTPEVIGVVTRIAADLVSDPRTGLSYYPVRITLAEGERERLGSMRLLPGMPIECFVQTGDRVVLSYLTKPLLDQVMRAFRQD